MVKTFGATSTAEELLSGIDLHGKRILVTGVSAGLGVEMARSLAAHGAHVVGTARDLAKAEAATAQIRKEGAANGGSFELVELDLASLASVRSCADQLQSSELDQVAASVQATPMKVALAWLLQRSRNILLIPGTSSIRHLRDNLSAAALQLPSNPIAELNAITQNARAAAQPAH